MQAAHQGGLVRDPGGAVGHTSLQMEHFCVGASHRRHWLLQLTTRQRFSCCRYWVTLCGHASHTFTQIEHFDVGVRHWLLQLTTQFGEAQTINGLQGIATATNLEGVR